MLGLLKDSPGVMNHFKIFLNFWLKFQLGLVFCFGMMISAGCGDRADSASGGISGDIVAERPLVGGGETNALTGLWMIDADDPIVSQFVPELAGMTVLLAEAQDQSQLEFFLCQNGSRIDTLRRLDDQYVVSAAALGLPGDIAVLRDGASVLIRFPVEGLGDFDLPLVAAPNQGAFSFSWENPSVSTGDSDLHCGRVVQDAQTGVMLTSADVINDHIMLTKLNYPNGLIRQTDVSQIAVMLASALLPEWGHSAELTVVQGAASVIACDAQQLSLRLASQEYGLLYELTHALQSSITCPENSDILVPDDPPIVDDAPSIPIVPDDPPPASDGPNNSVDMPVEDPVQPVPTPTEPEPAQDLAKCDASAAREALTGVWALSELAQSLLNLVAGQFPELLEQAGNTIFFVDQGQRVQATVCQDTRVRINLNRNGQNLESPELSSLLAGAADSGLAISGVKIVNDDVVSLDLPVIDLNFEKNPIGTSKMCFEFDNQPQLPESEVVCTAVFDNGLKFSIALDNQLMEMIISLQQQPVAGTYTLGENEVLATLISERFIQTYGTDTVLVKEGAFTIQAITMLGLLGHFNFILPDGQVLKGTFNNRADRI